MSVNSHDFKRCLSYFAKGITVITCPNPNGDNIGITVDSFNSVSLDPPLILFSINKLALSHDILINSPNFLINILSEKQIHLSKNFASKSSNKWYNIECYLSPNSSNRIIKGSLFYLECERFAVYSGGDHSIILGKVVNLGQISEDNPLIYFKGGYHKILPL